MLQNDSFAIRNSDVKFSRKSNNNLLYFLFQPSVMSTSSRATEELVLLKPGLVVTRISFVTEVLIHQN